MMLTMTPDIRPTSCHRLSVPSLRNHFFKTRLHQSSYFIPLLSHESVILSTIFHYHDHDQQKQPVILSLIQSIDMAMEYS